jgi:hypothetical protein
VLDDDERKALLDLERRLADEDPDLARSLRDEIGPPSSRPRAGQVAVTTALVFSVVLLLAGFPSAAVACALTTGLLWLMPRLSETEASEEPENEAD